MIDLHNIVSIEPERTYSQEEGWESAAGVYDGIKYYEEFMDSMIEEAKRARDDFPISYWQELSNAAATRSMPVNQYWDEVISPHLQQDLQQGNL